MAGALKFSKNYVASPTKLTAIVLREAVLLQDMVSIQAEEHSNEGKNFYGQPPGLSKPNDLPVDCW